jgi:hypothetical protein
VPLKRPSVWKELLIGNDGRGNIDDKWTRAKVIASRCEVRSRAQVRGALGVLGAVYVGDMTDFAIARYQGVGSSLPLMLPLSRWLHLPAVTCPWASGEMTVKPRGFARDRKV